jgi:DNA-binding FrmR family transcriptional regulator
VRKIPVGEKAAPAPASAPAPVPITEYISVPPGLSTFVTLPLFAQTMQKIKDQSKAISVSVSYDEKTSKVSVVITASTVETKTIARKLIEEELTKSLKNKLQKPRKVIDEDDTSDTRAPSPVASPTKMKAVPPTKMKTALPEKSKPAEALLAAKVKAVDEVASKQSALSSSSATQIKVTEKGRGKTDGLSALLQAMKQLPDSEVKAHYIAIFNVFSTPLYHSTSLEYCVH